MKLPQRPVWQALAGIAGSALLLGLYARGGDAWPLGFIALVPWLLALERIRSLRGALASALAMSIAFALAVFAWFAIAIGGYTGLGTAAGALALVVAAPLLQPQWLAFALLRHWVGRRHGPGLRALAAAAAWVGCEWLCPKLLGDTLGHGLADATTLRQVADLGGAAAITLLLLLANEALAQAILQFRRVGARALARPLALACALPLAMAGYGMYRLAELRETLSTPVPALRVGLVQANLSDYERRREEFGAYAVVRQVLDRHFELSRAAIEHHGAQALLWTETVYPTTFGQPRSADGAALDREILDFVEATRVPLVFGSYDLDAAGEYNSAAFVEPGRGLVGHYRKTHPFPLSEHVPAWLDGPTLRRWLPWTGHWQPGDGARVYTLRGADGIELDVQPLICLDDVVPQLAIDGARLGAQAIVGLSNDAWFSANPQGARLHLAVASFRSIETRMPQLRVTTTGLSAFIDPSGEVLVRTGLGDQAVLVGEIPVRAPPITLMAHWGDWLGAAALGFLALLGTFGFARGPATLAPDRRCRLATAREEEAGLNPIAAERTPDGIAIPVSRGSHDAVDESQRATRTGVGLLCALSPGARSSAALLRALAAGVLLMLGLRMLLVNGLQVNSLWQIQLWAGGVLLPLLLAHAIRLAGRARVEFDGPHLVLRQRHRRIEIPLANIARLHPWRLPLPGPGVDIEFASGQRWKHGLWLADPLALHRTLAAAGAPAIFADAPARHRAEAAAAHAFAHHRWLDHAAIKFGLYPLLLALPAFRLHQLIAFGGAFGEWQTYGAQAWLLGLCLWWAAWSLGLMLYAALLGAACGGASALIARWYPTERTRVAAVCSWIARGAYYFGVPTWLLLRLWASP